MDTEQADVTSASRRRTRPRAWLSVQRWTIASWTVRIVLLALVLLGLLLIPRVRRHQERVNIERTDAAERAADRMPLASSQPPSVPNDPDRLGYTYGWRATSDANRLWASCLGAPPSPGREAVGDCDPKGDTSCRTRLPVLCTRSAGDAMEMATSTAVPGFALSSADGATARCKTDLGPQWQVARGGWALDLNAVRQTGMSVDTHRRAWVWANAPGNCWDR